MREARSSSTWARPSACSRSLSSAKVNAAPMADPISGTPPAWETTATGWSPRTNVVSTRPRLAAGDVTGCPDASTYRFEAGSQ